MREPITIDVPLRLNVVQEVDIRGMKLHGQLGPLDFPERVRIGMIDNPPRAYVDFLYVMLPEEEATEHGDPSGLRISVGNHSKRVLRLEIPMPLGEKEGVMRFEGSERGFELSVHVRKQMNALKEEARKLPPEARPARLIAHYSTVADMVPFIEGELDKFQGAASR